MAISTQKDQLQRSTGFTTTGIPEKSQPDVNDPQTTGELGSEGRSDGDLPQQKRIADALDAVTPSATERGVGRALGGLVWLVIGLCAALVVFWYFSS